MAEYMTTREVARYLRLNEKRIYALIADEQMPAARIGGKWLFPRDVVDAWVAGTLRLPERTLIDSLLDDLLVIQGSDDWLLEHTIDRYRRVAGRDVVSARIGSMAGLKAVAGNHAHMAGFHLGSDDLGGASGAAADCYVVTLFERSQGLMFDRAATPGLRGLADVASRGLPLADRQLESGTYRLTERLLREAGLARPDLHPVGPYATHLEVALAVRAGHGAAGIGSAHAARLCGLDFVPLADETFRLAVPARLAAHPRVKSFIEFLLEDIHGRAAETPIGYGFARSGRLETNAVFTDGIDGDSPREKR